MTDRDRHLERARELLRAHPVFDGHNDLPWTIRQDETAAGDVTRYDLRTRTRGHTDLPRLRAGGVGAQFWSVFVPARADVSGRGFGEIQLEQIDLAHRMIARYPDDLAFCRSADEVEAAMAAGRVASLLGMEGGHVIENSLEALRRFHELGAAYLTLTHTATIDWADAATDAPRSGGLAPFGREVVREMNRLGMLVDLSHVSPDTMRDALDASAAPVIFSHSSARAVCDVARNVPDRILARLPANGGICMVTFVAGFVSPAAAAALVPAMAEFERRSAGIGDLRALRRLRDEIVGAVDVPLPGVAEVADHVEHVARVAGHDHVGLGGDFDGSLLFPTGLEDVSGYPRLIAELIARGWTDAQL
ncbi:MAG TPA: dipeptidase, partial [Candidatus Limnocylindria bacterium]|nr:dipeptidase [Candidatus Limnocylindria bacterium]